MAIDLDQEHDSVDTKMHKQLTIIGSTFTRDIEQSRSKRVSPPLIRRIIMKQHLRLRRLLEVLSLLLLVVRSRSTTSVDAFAFSSHVSTTSSASSSAMIVATTKRRLHHHFIYHSTHSRTPMGGISSSSSRRTMTMLYNNMSSNENDDGNNNMVNKSNNDDNSDTNNNGIDEELLQDDDAADSESFSSSTTTSTSLSRQDSGSSNDNTNNIEQPKKVNPYLDAIATPPPSDLISQFANTASSRAKNAARATIAGLMGGLTSNMMNGGVGQKGGYEDGFGAVGNGGASSDAAAGGVMDAREKNANNVGFTSKIVATGARLANLMFQLQMTGYMLRNAEYRLELGRSLGPPSSSSEKISRMLPSQLSKVNDEERLRTRRGRIVKGTKIKVRYGDADAITGEEEDVSNDDGEEESILSSPFMGLEVEVDAKAYVSELRGEIKRLRDAIESTRRAKEEEVQEDLL